MYQFIFCCWDPSQPSEVDAAIHLSRSIQRVHCDWYVALENVGFKFYAPKHGLAEQSLSFLHGNRGLILGQLFAKRGATGTDREETSPGLSEDETTRTIVSGGRHLIEQYWGSYVALLLQPRIPQTIVLRSPMCQFGCFTVEHRHVLIGFGCISDLAALNVVPLSVSWNFIAHSLQRTFLPDQTAITEVTRIVDGESLRRSRSRTLRHRLWDPLTIANSDPIREPDAAVEAVRSAAQLSVGTWGRHYDSILLRLSGGIDSSIVMSCLDAAGCARKVTAVNRFSPGADSDERRYARLAATAANCELIELERKVSFEPEDLLRARLTETPRSYLVIVSQSRLENAMASERHIPVIFTGSWGDEIFYSNEVKLSAADFVYDHGPKLQLIPVALNGAELDRVSAWRVLIGALSMGFRQVRWSMAQIARPLNTLVEWAAVDRELRPEAFKPCWFSNESYVPPGKQFQIATLSMANFVGGPAPYRSADDAYYVAPLLSQPLVETCLRIPTYVLSCGGWNRAIARRAFRGRVPQEILRRRTKGGQERFTAEIFSRHRTFMRELMLDGHLVRKGWLSRSKVAAALSDTPSSTLQGMRKLSQHVEHEVWLKTCERSGIAVDPAHDTRRAHLPEQPHAVGV